MEKAITKNTVVNLEFVLTLANGKEIDRADANHPFEYLHGFGNIVPGLENALDGMMVGQEKQVIVTAEDGYGERDEDDVVEIPREKFPDSMELKVGNPMKVQDSQSGEAFRAYIAELHSDSVVLDFNHPLAGETLHFQIKVVSLRDASEEELAHGHAHGNGHSH